MANGITPWLLGRDITVQITPQDVSSNGVFTNDAIGALTFTGRLEEDSFENTLQTQDYRPVQAFNANPVPVSYVGTYTLTEIAQALPLLSSGSGWGYGNVLETAFRTSFYHKIVVSAFQHTITNTYTESGSGSPVYSWTFYALMTNVKRNSPKQMNTFQATLQTISISNGSSGFISNPSVS